MTKKEPTITMVDTMAGKSLKLDRSLPNHPLANNASTAYLYKYRQQKKLKIVVSQKGLKTQKILNSSQTPQ